MTDSEDNATTTPPEETEKRTRKTTPMRCFEMAEDGSCTPFGDEFTKITEARQFLHEYVADKYTSDDDVVPNFTIQRVLASFTFKRQTTVSFVEA